MSADAVRPLAGQRIARAGRLHWLNEAGYRSVVLLALALPFDLTQHALLDVGGLALTDLKILLFAVAALALATLAGEWVAAARSPGIGARLPKTNQLRSRVAALLFVAFLLSSFVSSFLAHDAGAGFRWDLNLALGGLLCLAIPRWLDGERDARVNRIGMALVAGAVVSSVIGFAEFLPGSKIDQNLTWIRPGPITMGPYLRLSATFSHPNVAAMYVELALPFAAAGLIGALRRHPRTVIAWLAALDILLAALFLTYSRGGMLGLVAAVVVMAFAGRNVWRWEQLVRLRRWVVVIALDLALVTGIFGISSSSIEMVRVTTQTDRSWYSAAYVASVPGTMTTNRSRAIRLTVENLSPLTWIVSSPHAYGLGYHWLYRSQRVARFDSTLAWLTRSVRPGGRATVLVTVRPPEKPGRYLLVWDLLWHNTAWFGLNSASYRAMSVRVLDGRRHPVTRSSEPADAPFTYLPATQEPDREQLWAAAVTIVERQPLFGGGPHAVPKNYESIATSNPIFGASKPPPHAHNLVLELLADWGLIGGGLFLGWLMLVWWPFIATVGRGNTRIAWQVAVAGAAAAVIGHQSVDYFLGAEPVLIALWLLSGLALANGRWRPL